MKPSSKPAPTSRSPGNKTRGQFNLLFHNNPLPMWVYDVKSLRFLDVNPAAVKQYGFTRAEFLAMRVPDITDRKNHAHQKTKLPGKRSAGQQAEKVRHCRKDGSIIHVQITSHKITYEGHKAALAAINDITEKKQVEEALRKTENSYRYLIEHTQLLICTHDLQGNLLSINPWATKAMGYESKNLVGKNIQTLLVPGRKNDFKRYLLKIRKHGAAQGLMQVLTASGERRIWEYHCTLRIEGDAAPIVSGLAYDITERKLAEEALGRSEAMYRGLFDNVLDGIFRSAPDGRLISANPSLVRMLGYESEEELLSVNVKEFYPDPQVRSRNIRISNKTGELRNIEIEIKRRDGKLITVLENSHTVRDSKGRIILYEGTLTDISDRKHAEEALRTSEGELRALFEAIPDLVLVIDKDGRYLKIASTNPILAYFRTEDMVGRRMHEIFSRQKADELVGHIREALRTQKLVQFEYAQLIGDQILWFSGAAIPLTKNTVVWVARDITPQKSAEEQIQRRLVELEALYESGLVLSQTLDPRQIGQNVIRLLSDRLDLHHAAVRVRRGESDDVELLAFSEIQDKDGQTEVSQSLARNAITKVGQGMAGWVMKHGRLINSGHLRDDPRYHQTFPNMLSGLYVPIWAGGRVLGCISVEIDQHDAFTVADELLLTTLASQAAAALENARLFAETQQQAAESNALYEATRNLTTQTDFSTLLKTLGERAATLLNTPGGGVYLYNPETNELEIVSATLPNLPMGTRLKIGEGMAGRVAEKREALIVDDYQNWEGRSSQYADQSFRAVLEVPMLYRGELIGVIAAFDMHSPADEGLSAAKENRKFTKDDERLLSLFAASAAGAIYSARLFDAERLRRKDAEELRLIAVRSAERLSVLHTATQEIAGISPEPEQVYASIHLAASRLMSTEAFTIVLVDEEHYELNGVYLFDRDGRSPSMSIPFGQGFSSRVILSGETMLVNDVETNDKKIVHFGSPERTRSVLAVPLRVGGHVIGAISAQSYQANTYKEEDRVLLEMLAAQAAIAIQNARLYHDALRSAERRSVLHQVSQEMARLNQKPEQLYAAIQGAAAQLVPTDLFFIALKNDAKNRVDVVYTSDRGKRSPDVRFPIGPGYTGWVIENGKTLLIRDSRGTNPVQPVNFSDGEDTRSVLVVPLQLGQKVIGAMSAQCYNKDQYGKEDRAIFEMLASQVAIAIENARLFDQTRRRLNELESLTSVSKALTGTLEFRPLLENILKAARQAIPAAEKGTILMREENEQDHLHVRAQVGYADPRMMELPFDINKAYAGHAFHEKRPILIHDSQAEYGTLFDRKLEEVNTVRSAIVAPLLVKDEAIGAISLDNASRTSAFDKEDLDLLVLFASSAAVVIENARLFEKARKTADEFANLYETAHDLSGQHNLDDLLNLIVERAGLLLHAPISGIYLYDEVKNDLFVAVNRGLTTSLGIRLAMGEGVAGRVAQSRQPMIIEDHQHWEGRSAHYTEVPLRSVLEVPMLYGGQLIGVLTVDEIGDSERKFTQEDAALLSLFASQAAAAVYSARLFEKASQRAGEFEALYQTAADLSSQSDLPTLLNTIIQRAWVLTRAAGAGLYLFDSERGDLELVAIHDPDIRPGIRLDLGEGVSGRVAQTQEPLLVNNYRNWNGRSPKYEGIPHTSVIAVPMLYSGELIGVLDVFNRADKNISGQPREFTEQDTNLISLFANAAAGAVYGARLLDETRRRVEELDAIARVSSALRTASTRADMAPIILAQLREILHADGALFCTLEPASQEIVVELAQGNLESLTGFRIPANEGLTARVIHSRQVYTTLNLQDEPDVFLPDRLKNARTAAIIPFVSQDNALGALWVTRTEKNGTQPPVFDKRQLRILSAISDITANAIQRVSLFEKTTHYAEQMETVNAMGHALSETLDLPGIYEKTARSALELLPDTAKVTISLFEPQTKLITTVYGLRDGELLYVAALPSTPLDESGKEYPSKVISSARSVIVSDLNESHEDIQAVDVKERSVEADSNSPLRSALYIPMQAEGRVIGILQLQSYSRNRYSPGDAELMELAANTAASSIQNTRLFSQLKRRVDQLSALHAVDTAIGSTTDLRVSLQSVLENITRQLRVDAAAVLLLNSSTLILQYAAGAGFLTSEIMRSSFSIGRGPAGKAALDREMVYIPDVNKLAEGYLNTSLINSERFVTFLAMPLMAKGEVKGVLEIFNRSPLEMNEEWKSFLEMLAGQAALAIDNALLFEGLEKANVELVMAYDATIEGWSQALELRDQETQGHSARVLDQTLRLASIMNLSDKEMQDIRRGVLLHDIGKMGIPDAILHKPGPLTEEEWETMRKHPKYAYDMLAPIVYLRNSLDIPYCHHEKWDGTGYPRHLKGETIPLAARIFSVVDVYDALTSDRPYRKAWSKEKTIEHIVGQSGKHFDPHVVDIFVKQITAQESVS